MDRVLAKIRLADEIKKRAHLKHDMLHMMADAVYVDMKPKEVVGFKLKAAFLHLFNLGEPVKTGELDGSGRLHPKYLPPGLNPLHQWPHTHFG